MEVFGNSTAVATFAPDEFIPFAPAEKAFTMLAGVLVGLVWLLMWRYAPKKSLRINDPRKRMHLVYAAVAAGLLGHFAGHSFPNALIHAPAEPQSTHFVTLAMMLGVAAAVAFFKFSRTCGVASDQAVLDPGKEPVGAFIDEDGTQGEYVRTTTSHTSVALSVASEGHYTSFSESQQFINSSSLEDSASRDASPRGRLAIGVGGVSQGDDGSEDVASTSDDVDILWMRRKMAWIVFALYTLYTLSDALFMAYNNHGQPPGVLVACFWIYKLVNSLTLSGIAVYAYVHLHPRRCCCNRYRPAYLVCAVISVLASVASALPVTLDVPPEQVSVVVESLYFRLFSGFFSGWLLWVAFIFITSELRVTTARVEFLWWFVFIVTGAAVFVTGVFL